MKKSKLEALTKEILLVLFNRSSRYETDEWDLDSAFRAIEREPSHSEVRQVADKLADKGWATLTTDVSLQRTKIGVCLTPLGKVAAVELLEKRSPKSLLERLHSAHWATWGGMAAIVAALASVTTCVKS